MQLDSNKGEYAIEGQCTRSSHIFQIWSPFWSPFRSPFRSLCLQSIATCSGVKQGVLLTSKDSFQCIFRARARKGCPLAGDPVDISLQQSKRLGDHFLHKMQTMSETISKCIKILKVDQDWPRLIKYVAYIIYHRYIHAYSCIHIEYPTEFKRGLQELGHIVIHRRSISEVVRLSPARISLQVQWAKQDNSPGPEICIFSINQDLVHKVRDLFIVPYHASNSNSSGHIYVLRIPKGRPFSTETRETKQKPNRNQRESKAPCL